MTLFLPQKFEENPVFKKAQKITKYMVAILAPFFLAAILIFIPFLEFALSSVSLLFMGVVVISAWYGGMRAGTLSTLLSAVLVNYYFTTPYTYEVFLQANGAAKFVLFIVEGTFISYILDKVGRRREIAEFKQRIKGLKEIISEQDTLNDSLKKEIRSRDEFMSIASHELKTPLTSMLLQTQHALHSIKNVSLADFSIQSLLKMLESVENQTNRLSKMINDFLNISLITTGNLQLEKEKMNLNETVKAVITEFAPRLETEEYELKYFEEDSVSGTWDKTRIEQVLSNVLSNAIKYGSGKPIEITVRKSFNHAQVLVKDHGIGIPKQKQKKVFELFERGVTNEEYRGLGVGLYITNEIVKAHGGKIVFSSKENRGTTFIVELPLSE